MAFLMNSWYCAALTEEIGEAPVGRRLLDLPVLLVRDEAGAVRAIGDMCPHRFAPLHQGKRLGDVIECPYHGLRFDLSGTCVHNPHGSGKIPGAAKVPSYPVVEQQGAVWFWPGDPGLADVALVPDLRFFEEFGPPIGDHLTMDVDYRLVIDNLLDLSHAPYLHAGTLSPAGAERETRFEQTDRSVHAFYLMRDVPTPSSQALNFKDPRGDFYSDIQWLAPTVLRHQLAMTRTGATPEDGSVSRGAHLITPETATKSHYFWLSSRNRPITDPAMIANVKAMVRTAFMTEDEPMVAACQENMAGREFFSLKPLYLETDYAGSRARRTLEKLIEEEASGSASLA